MNSKAMILIISIILMTGFSSLLAQDSSKTSGSKKPQTQVFVDDDGDGYNDNAPDHDGDGIPNGLDADWIKLQKEHKKNQKKRFVDLDGDGIDDNLQRGEQNDERASEMKASAGSMGESNNQQQKGQKKQYKKGKK